MGLNVIMLGAPGAGKGTQADRFARQRGLPRISTGDILRQGVKDQLPVALVAKARMDRGELVDDETMVTIVRERLARPDTDAGFVLDGFPRTVSQARSLDAIIDARGNGPLVVVDIVVREEELVRRLAGRRICSTCGTNAEPADGAGTTCQRCGGTLVHRVDDSEQVVIERLKVYYRTTQPLVDYYLGRPTFRTVDGAQPPDRVAQALDATIDAAAGQGACAPVGAQGPAPL
ncbi:MAG: adenylate kinase [Acidobacteria bacterium]|nr:adenylate kinase [Acidobacteriota bacterium]